MEKLLCQIEEVAAESGLFETGWLDVGELKFYPEVRKICEGNSCRNYGSSWACPPAVGTMEECRERVRRYDKMLLFSVKYALEDSFDFDGMAAGLRSFKKTVDVFHRGVRPLLPDCLLLSNEGCGRCDACTYPQAPCRFPEWLHHSLEGYGFVVNELARQAGIHYNNGANSVTYFGALLFRGKGAAA